MIVELFLSTVANLLDPSVLGIAMFTMRTMHNNIEVM